MKKNGMKRLMVAGILCLGMVAIASPVAAQSRFSIGIGIGMPGYYAPAPVVAYRPPCPGPGYSWVDGYYDPYGAWVGGYWAAPVVVRPYYGYGAGFYGGYYGGYRRGFDRDGFRGGRGWGHEHGRGYGYRR